MGFSSDHFMDRPEFLTLLHHVNFNLIFIFIGTRPPRHFLSIISCFSDPHKFRKSPKLPCQD